LIRLSLAERKNFMNISILGAGAMGSFFGGLLAESGQTVTLIDINEQHLGAIRDQGLRLQTDQGDRRIGTLRVNRPEEAVGHPDLLIVFTKTMHTASALRGVRHLLGEHTQVLSLQNGLGNVETIADLVDAERILIGVTTWPADMVGAGHVHSHGEGAIYLMTADGVARPALALCVEALQGAGLNCRADPNVWASIWEKVAFNAALNSVCAVTRCTVDQLDDIPEGRELALRIATEVVEVARASGVHADANKACGNVVNAIAKHRGHKPSMLQDILAGRRTEVDSINGAVVKAATKLGLSVPCTQSMWTLVRLIELQSSPHPSQ
jgi:2-dehydropantoate 2-reductase